MAKRGRKAFSNFYHLRYNRIGLNAERAAEIIGTTIEQINDWDLNGAPTHVEKYLMLWDKKRIGHEGWDGWYFSRGVLKFGKQQWYPENILLDRKEVQAAMNERLLIVNAINRKFICNS